LGKIVAAVYDRRPKAMKSFFLSLHNRLDVEAHIERKKPLRLAFFVCVCLTLLFLSFFVFWLPKPSDFPDAIRDDIFVLAYASFFCFLSLFPLALLIIGVMLIRPSIRRLLAYIGIWLLPPIVVTLVFCYLQAFSGSYATLCLIYKVGSATGPAFDAALIAVFFLALWGWVLFIDKHGRNMPSKQ